ncbi:hypothetical protein I302_104114 [Kwoniella bestiolae CBS 10118]|uniref:Oxidoreductase n=1 Tax=Kwoniella bestiolae CBS 10118 TaxID=1296100 RepID=A0A1B9GAC3_9TREE|nr:hypothetical protein I302_02822 [Kwoniella bestiolae CBS 10118]OCF27972.1 hypothetical protein I302_02822 [Kwoniella bestiolae CBS 10118]
MSLPWSIYRELWTPYPPAPQGDYLRGKVVVITGATSGIGLEATKQLAAASPSQMILAVRSVEAGEKVLQQIKASYKGLEGKVIHCDLQDFTSLKECVENIKRDYDRVDLLINNAGMNPNFDEGPYKSTIDGYERVFQTNVLAPLLMTFLLLPLLRRSNGPKVIFTGSDAHIFATHALIQTSVDNHQSIVGAYNDEGKYHQPARYFESKAS